MSTWRCPKCHNQNPESYLECEVCELPRADADHIWHTKMGGSDPKVSASPKPASPISSSALVTIEAKSHPAKDLSPTREGTHVLPSSKPVGMQIGIVASLVVIGIGLIIFALVSGISANQSVNSTSSNQQLTSVVTDIIITSSPTVFMQTSTTIPAAVPNLSPTETSVSFPTEVQPTQKFYSTPTIVMPTATLVCSSQVDKAFAKAWPLVRNIIGCPQNQITDTFADQNFENGKMIWRGLKSDSPNGGMESILVMHNDGTWEIVESPKFDPNRDPTDSCPNIIPPPGKRRPLSGFGKLWCSNPDLRARLGYATDKERGYVWGVFTEFDYGFMVFNYEGRALIFYSRQSANSGRWEDGKR